MSDLPPTSEYPQYSQPEPPQQPPSNDPTQAYGQPAPGYLPPATGAPTAPGYVPGQPAATPGYTPGQPPAQPVYTPGQAAAGPPVPGYTPGQAPVYGQPPVSGAPQAYGQPDYAQQAGWQQQQPGYLQTPPAKSRKGLWITLGIVGVLLIGLCGAGAVAAVYYANPKTEDASSTSGTTPTASKSAPAATKSPATVKSTVTLTAPDSIGGRKKNNDPTMNESVVEMKDTFGSMAALGIGEPVAAVYGDPKKQDLLMLVAFPVSNNLMADVQFEAMFKGMEASSGGTMSNTTDVPPGKLGGKARCGDLELSGIDVAVCAWADEGSVGMVFWYFSSVSKVKSEFITVREQVEKKA